MSDYKQKYLKYKKKYLDLKEQSGGDVKRIVREIYSVNAKLINFQDGANFNVYSIGPEINFKFNLVEYKYNLFFRNNKQIEVEYKIDGDNTYTYTLLAKRPFVKFIINGDNNREVYQLITDKNKVDKTTDIFITDVKSSTPQYQFLESFYASSAKGFLTPNTTENSFVEKFEIKKEYLKNINNNVLTAYIDNDGNGYFNFSQPDYPDSYQPQKDEKPFYIV
tara:strand:- start:117 stop:779 length:663 start_codon:yes stop_codon:yes gene_type:complete